MIEEEEDWLVYKLNAGEEQENIKFPAEYRAKINYYLQNAVGISVVDMENIHSNSCLEEKK